MVSTILISAHQVNLNKESIIAAIFMRRILVLNIQKLRQIFSQKIYISKQKAIEIAVFRADCYNCQQNNGNEPRINKKLNIPNSSYKSETRRIIVFGNLG